MIRMLLRIFLPRYVLAGESSVLGRGAETFKFSYVEVAWLTQLMYDTNARRIPEYALSGI